MVNQLLLTSDYCPVRNPPNLPENGSQNNRPEHFLGIKLTYSGLPHIVNSCTCQRSRTVIAEFLYGDNFNASTNYEEITLLILDLLSYSVHTILVVFIYKVKAVRRTREDGQRDREAVCKH